MNEDFNNNNSVDSDPSDDSLISVELQVRLMNLVLGEASDFECDQLQLMMEQRAEVSAYYQQLAHLHGLLSEVGAGDPSIEFQSTVTETVWQLPVDRRAQVLAVLDKSDNDQPDKVVLSKTSEPKHWRMTIAQLAVIALTACVLVGLMLPAVQSARKSARQTALAFNALEEVPARTEAEAHLTLDSIVTDLRKRADFVVEETPTTGPSASPLPSIQWWDSEQGVDGRKDRVATAPVPGFASAKNLGAALGRAPDSKMNTASVDGQAKIPQQADKSVADEEALRQRATAFERMRESGKFGGGGGRSGSQHDAQSVARPTSGSAAEGIAKSSGQQAGETAGAIIKGDENGIATDPVNGRVFLGGIVNTREAQLGDRFDDDSNGVATNSRSDTEQQVASLVETYNDMMDKRNYAEAEAVAKQVAMLDPNTLTSRPLSARARYAHNSTEYENILNSKEEGFIASLNNVDRAATPITGAPSVNYPPEKGWEAFSQRPTDRTGSVREADQPQTETADFDSLPGLLQQTIDSDSLLKAAITGQAVQKPGSSVGDDAASAPGASLEAKHERRFDNGVRPSNESPITETSRNLNEESVTVAGQTLPSPYYLYDDVQYFPAVPPAEGKIIDSSELEKSERRLKGSQIFDRSSPDWTEKPQESTRALAEGVAAQYEKTVEQNQKASTDLSYIAPVSPSPPFENLDLYATHDARVKESAAVSEGKDSPASKGSTGQDRTRGWRVVPAPSPEVALKSDDQANAASTGKQTEKALPPLDEAATKDSKSEDRVLRLKTMLGYGEQTQEQIDALEAEFKRNPVPIEVEKKVAEQLNALAKNKKGDSLKLPEYLLGTLRTRNEEGAEGRKIDANRAKAIDEQSASSEAFSTFSLHVSDVSFKLAQTALSQGQWPDAAKIRIEEFVNALDYHDPLPTGNQKVACRVEQAIHPFLMQRNLLRVSMRTAATGRAQNTPLRLTLLLDNSGSMERPDRRQAVLRAFQTLTQQLKATDQITLISFASTPRLLADKVPGNQGETLLQLVENLPSEGGTNIEAALLLAREKATEQQIPGAQNRIVLLTDGAVNLGNANPQSLAKLVLQMRDSGIAFDAAGISAQDLNDEVLEALTRQGDGRYYLLDSAESVDKTFAAQIAGALRPSAQNVKVQVEFNPKRVGRYKLLGFENHRLDKEDFRNDKVDAAEMAAAEAGVAVYQFEIKPNGSGDVGNVSVRFRDLSTGEMVENRWPIPYESNTPRLEQADPSMQLAASAALFAAMLSGGPLGDSVDLVQLQKLLSNLSEQCAGQPRVKELRTMIDQTIASGR